MATISKYVSKSGEITYYIRAYDGYDSSGKQIEHRMSWKPPKNMSEKQIERELQKQISRFEDSIKTGTLFDSDTRFSEYAETWLEDNKFYFAPKTYERYKSLLEVINMAIGDIKLTKLQSHHLQQFYNNLRENGISKRGTYAVTKKLKQLLHENNISTAKLAELSGLSTTTIRAAVKGNHVSIESAEKIADTLNIPVKKLFTLHTQTTGLAPKTILHYHRLISVILVQAVRDRLIPDNVADRNHMKAPKLEYKETNFLNDDEVRNVLELLEKENIKWKTAMYLLIYSGMRRGELMGLEWSDIDFENKVIHIRRTSQYLRSIGTITKSPKNRTSFRTIKLSDMMFAVLQEYKDYWNRFRKELIKKNVWKEKIEITLADGTSETVHNERLFIQDDSTPMNPDSITHWTRKFVQRNNLPNFSPHALRHTHATLLIAEGVSIPAVSHRLGHASVTTTSRVYIHAIQSADEIAAEALDNKLNSDKNKKK